MAISLDEEQYRTGDTVHAAVTISNTAAVSITSNLVVSLTADYPLSMRFPDQVLQTLEGWTDVGPGGSETIIRSFELPLSLSSDNIFYVEAAFSDERAMTSFDLDPRFDWNILLPDKVRKDTEFVAELTS